MIYFHRNSFLIYLVSILTSFALQNYSFSQEVQSARTLALGGAGRAGPILTDPVTLNPSFCSFVPAYAISASYSKYDFAPDVYGRSRTASVVDGRNVNFQGGLSYALHENSRVVNFAASKRVLPNLSLGLGGKWWFETVTYPDQVRDLSLSATYIASEKLQAAVVFNNLLEDDKIRARGISRQAELGLKYNLEKKVLLYADGVYANRQFAREKWSASGGAEFPLMHDLFLRGGITKNYRLSASDSVIDRAWSAGAGWLAPKLSLDYAFFKIQSPYDGTLHQLMLSVYF